METNNSVCRKIFYTLMGNMSTIISRVTENGIVKVDGRIVVYEKDSFNLRTVDNHEPGSNPIGKRRRC